MKRGLLLSILSLAMIVFFANGLQAQTHDGTAVTGYSTTAYATGGAVHVVEGGTVPVYAKPDTYYHPNWDASTSTWTLTDGFTWSWTVPAGLSASQNDAEDNYVEITGDAAGSYTLEVAEVAPAAYGGCSGAAQTISVTVYPQPTVTLGGDATYDYCAGDASLPTGVTATISDGYQAYRLVWSLEIKTLNADGTDKAFYDDDKATSGVPLAVEYTTTAPEAVAASGAHDITTVVDGGSGLYEVIDNSVTVYTYSLVSINDQSSRNANFIGLTGDATDASAFTYYATAETVTVSVYPTPVTGPIYHIPTTWAN